MKCSKCGNYIPDDSVFCQYCGCDLQEQQMETENSVETNNRKQSTERFKKLFIFAVCIAIILGGMCAYLGISYYPIASFMQQQASGNTASNFSINDTVLTTEVGKANTIDINCKSNQDLHAEWNARNVSAVFSDYNKLLITTLRRGISVIVIKAKDTGEKIKVLVVSY